MPNEFNEKNDEKRQIMLKLAGDVITFGLNMEEEKGYFKMALGKKVSDRTIRRWKREYNEDDTAQTWMHNFTKVGFVKFQHEHMTNLQKLLDNSYRRFYEESLKPRKMPSDLTEEQKKRFDPEHDIRNDHIMLRIKADIRSTTELLNAMALGTPMQAQFLARLKEKGIIQR